MLDILLVVHIVISILLIIVLLLQKNSSDGLAGLGGGGGGNNMGIVTARTAANFFTRITVVLAVLFMSNSLLLANLSNHTRKDSDITHQLKESKTETKHHHKNQLPMAK